MKKKLLRSAISIVLVLAMIAPMSTQAASYAVQPEEDIPINVVFEGYDVDSGEIFVSVEINGMALENGLITNEDIQDEIWLAMQQEAQEDIILAEFISDSEEINNRNPILWWLAVEVFKVVTTLIWTTSGWKVLIVTVTLMGLLTIPVYAPAGNPPNPKDYPIYEYENVYVYC